MKLELNKTIGNRLLCAWQPVRGYCWVQTREPKFAEKLKKRSDSRLVMRGVAGGYLMTFEFKHSLAWAQRLIRRYMGKLVPANDALTAPATPQDAPLPSAPMPAKVPELPKTALTHRKSTSFVQEIALGDQIDAEELRPGRSER